MKILIVDDDVELTQLLGFTFRQAGFEAETEGDAEGALVAWQREQPHLILLDMSMPGRSGLYVLERVRAVSTVPIIMLTVRDSDEDVVRAFELGADDYVTKPFSPHQLVARVKAALRRAGSSERDEVQIGAVRLDLVHHEVTVAGGEARHLTTLELRLLEVMMTSPGAPLTPQRLIERVWGYEGHLGDQTLLKSLVRRVRLKIEPDPRQPRYVKTLLGVGYLFEAES
jgi:two-component system, OmpR family, response regulator MtrA